MRAWIDLLFLALPVVGIAGALFVMVAGFIKASFGLRTVWPTWIVFSALVTLPCTIIIGRQPGLAAGPSAYLMINTAATIFGLVAVPLGLGAFMLRRLHVQRPPRADWVQMSLAWVVITLAIAALIAFLFTVAFLSSSFGIRA